MLATSVSAAFVCVGALVLGQAVLRLCGAERWSWLAAPTGAAAAILVAVPALYVPGRSTTAAVVLFALTLAAAVWVLRIPAHRPPVAGLLAGVPVALLAALPFVSAGRAGTLGWSFNNDMATHLLLADGYRSELIERFNPLLPDYPLGPHALSAVLAQGFGFGVDEAFAGITIAATVLLGWTGLAALREPRCWAPFATTVLVGMPFLVAAYYGQGSFKELLEALFVLGFAVLLAFPPQLGRLRRWVPAALVLAGTVSVYSFLGLAWPVAFLGVWLAGSAIAQLVATRSPRTLLHDARAGLVPVVVGVGVLLLAIAPQLGRVASFVSNRSGTSGGIAKDDIGNLVRRLPVWEAFGIWGSPDYRLPAPDHSVNRIWIAFALGLVVFGAVWSLRRGEWMLVAATFATLLIWAVSDRSQSPYVAAKGLVMLSPLLLLVAVRALAERDIPGRGMPSWWWLAAPVLAALLLVRVGDSSYGALVQSRVGPTDHMRELRALQPTLAQRPTLFLGNDDFLRWELGETPVGAPVIGFQVLPIRTQKPWAYGQNYDVDSLDAGTLNQFDWVIAPRDAAASTPPQQLRVVRRTRDFVLYRRTGTIPPSEVLAESDGPAAPLDCRSPRGRALLRAGGVATIREAPVGVPAPPLSPGVATTVELPLRRGRWDLVASYLAPRPLEVEAAGLRTTLPANLDRPGVRWPIGRIAVTRSGPVAVRLRATDGRLTPDTEAAVPGTIVAVPVGGTRTVPLAEACGKLVDHYRVTGARGTATG